MMDDDDEEDELKRLGREPFTIPTIRPARNTRAV
jgi:hypothetical protein